MLAKAKFENTEAADAVAARDLLRRAPPPPLILHLDSIRNGGHNFSKVRSALSKWLECVPPCLLPSGTPAPLVLALASGATSCLGRVAPGCKVRTVTTGNMQNGVAEQRGGATRERGGPRRETRGGKRRTEGSNGRRQH